MKEYAELISEFTDQAEELKPVVKKAIKALVCYGPEIHELFNGIGCGVVDLQAAMIKRYQDVHGFTREEAILLTLDVRYALTRINNQNKKS